MRTPSMRRRRFSSLLLLAAASLACGASLGAQAPGAGPPGGPVVRPRARPATEPPTSTTRARPPSAPSHAAPERRRDPRARGADRAGPPGLRRGAPASPRASTRPRRTASAGAPTGSPATSSTRPTSSRRCSTDPKVKDPWARDVAGLARRGAGRHPFEMEGGLVAASRDAARASIGCRSARPTWSPASSTASASWRSWPPARARCSSTRTRATKPSWVDLRFDRVEVEGRAGARAGPLAHHPPAGRAHQGAHRRAAAAPRPRDLRPPRRPVRRPPAGRAATARREPGAPLLPARRRHDPARDRHARRGRPRFPCSSTAPARSRCCSRTPRGRRRASTCTRWRRCPTIPTIKRGIVPMFRVGGFDLAKMPAIEGVDSSELTAGVDIDLGGRRRRRPPRVLPRHVRRRRALHVDRARPHAARPRLAAGLALPGTPPASPAPAPAGASGAAPLRPASRPRLAARAPDERSRRTPAPSTRGASTRPRWATSISSSARRRSSATSSSASAGTRRAAPSSRSRSASISSRASRRTCPT